MSQGMIIDLAQEKCETFMNEELTACFHYGGRRFEAVSVHGNTTKKSEGKLFDKIQNKLFRTKNYSNI